MNVEVALTRFLNRKSPRPNMAGDTADAREARADESRALLRALKRAMPKYPADDWPDEFLDHLERRMKGGFWPVVGDIEKLAADRRHDAAEKGQPARHNPDPAELFAKRMMADERVSENDLFGIVAHNAVKQKLLTAEMVAQWREYAIAARVKLYGQEQTEAWLEERRERLRWAIQNPNTHADRRERTAEAAAAAFVLVKRMSDPIMEDAE